MDEEMTHIDRFLPMLPADRDGYTILGQVMGMGWTMNDGVYVAREKKTQKLALCKILNYHGSTVGMQEIYALQVAKGQHGIIQIHKESYANSEHRLYLEYCDGGSLRDLLEKYHDALQHIPEAFLWHVAESILRALCFLHLGIPQVSTYLTPRHDWPPMYHGQLQLDYLYMTTPTSYPVGNSYPRIVLAELSGLYIGTPPKDRVGSKWRKDRTVDFFTMLRRKVRMHVEDEVNDWTEHEWYRANDIRNFATIMCELSYTNHSTLRQTHAREQIYSPEWIGLMDKLNGVLDTPMYDWANKPTVDVILREVLRAKKSALARIFEEPLL
ncbi:hypothetical protein DM02DRAFT_628171 [Periconia macrospinosa]|uniref:Protein kinase domain-containing protein n=1 Tax=Periconia macrospinosa TaxID=97972 RepID=A0A2V1DRD4_9PLEO|nr:hypothetical protein DM02DRAFT_628171 [Periconia macrospinosa]